MSNLSTLPKGDSAWLLRKAIERIMEQVSVLETNIGSSTTGNSANTQIIFNDNGTLRGDAGLVYNKTTDALTVAGLVTAGSATITGAATVGTTLAVTGNLTAAADSILGTGSKATDTLLDFKADTGTQRIYLDRGGRNLIFKDVTTNIENYRITGVTGVHTWGVGGTTAMTLNATGLGIGRGPLTSLDVFGANKTNANEQGTLTVSSSDAFAIDKGGSIAFWGKYNTASGDACFARVYGAKENATDGNFVGYFAVATGGGGSPVERLRIDSTGNVGIGVTPTNAYSTSRALQIGQGGLIEGRSNDYTTFSLATNAYLSSVGDWTYRSNAKANLYAQSNGAFTWASVAAGTGVATFTPAMTLDANGRLLIGKTASALSTVGLEEAAGGYIQATVTSDASLFCNRLATDGETIKFYRQTVQVGNISVTTTATAYNTSSDYRLKESVQPLVGGLTRVNALKPSVYNWKSDGSAGEGFLAHELAEVVPAAVTGEKDAVNADGSIKSQGIDMSRVVPILVAAIQELTARVQTLEAR